MPLALCIIGLVALIIGLKWWDAKHPMTTEEAEHVKDELTLW